MNVTRVKIRNRPVNTIIVRRILYSVSLKVKYKNIKF